MPRKHFFDELQCMMIQITISNIMSYLKFCSYYPIIIGDVFLHEGKLENIIIRFLNRPGQYNINIGNINRDIIGKFLHSTTTNDLISSEIEFKLDRETTFNISDLRQTMKENKITVVVIDDSPIYPFDVQRRYRKNDRFRYKYKSIL